MSQSKFDEMSESEVVFWWVWRVLSIGLISTLLSMWGQAKKESAQHLADAEVIRAQGVAKANTIIGKSLSGNEAYLHYLFINNLEHTKNQVIYLPTERNQKLLCLNCGGDYAFSVSRCLLVEWIVLI